MRIGELSRRTGVATRLLRYYEEQGLLTPPRAGNTYRNYGEEDVARAERVALLVRSGVPTRLIKVLLDLEETERRDPAESCPLEVAELLAAELAGLDARIACLSRSRSTIQDFLIRTEHAALLRSTSARSRDRADDAPVGARDAVSRPR
jgi:DNA-binding transcriptional MerR regulator